MSFEKLFIESKGKPISFEGKELTLIDRISVAKTQHIKVEFIETNSDWKQGIVLKTKGDFKLDNGAVVPFRCVFWEDTAPKQLDVQVRSKNGELIVYNVWDVGNGTMQFGHNGSAMEVEIDGDERTYHCNDGFPDTDFNDLIFKINGITGHQT